MKPHAFKGHKGTAVCFPLLGRCHESITDHMVCGRSASDPIHTIPAERVKDVIAGVVSLPATRFAQDSELGADLGADSLDEVEIVMAIEEEFALEIPDEDAKWTTVGDVVKYIEWRVGRG